MQSFQQQQQLQLQQQASPKALWVGNLHYWMDEKYLTSIFGSSGELVNAKVIRNKVSGQPEGYGFVEFQTHACAEMMLQALNGTQMPHSKQMFCLNWAFAGIGNRKPKADSWGPEESIFVGDLAVDVTDALLMSTFRSRYPSVRSAKVVTHGPLGRSKGYGFVRFGDEFERLRAMTEMNGQYCSTRPMRINAVTPKTGMVMPGQPLPFQQQPAMVMPGQPHSLQQQQLQPAMVMPSQALQVSAAYQMVPAQPYPMSQQLAMVVPAHSLAIPQPLPQQPAMVMPSQPLPHPQQPAMVVPPQSHPLPQQPAMVVPVQQSRPPPQQPAMAQQSRPAPQQPAMVVPAQSLPIPQQPTVVPAQPPLPQQVFPSTYYSPSLKVANPRPPGSPASKQGSAHTQALVSAQPLPQVNVAEKENNPGQVLGSNGSGSPPTKQENQVDASLKQAESSAPKEEFDPIAPLDIDALNADYVSRHESFLVGRHWSLMRMAQLAQSA